MEFPAGPGVADGKARSGRDVVALDHADTVAGAGVTDRRGLAGALFLPRPFRLSATVS